MIISSRPSSSSIQNLRRFSVAKMSYIDKRHLGPIIVKVDRVMNEGDQTRAAELYVKLKNSNLKSIADLFTTPLMIVLLLWKYSIDTELPKKEETFFLELIKTLYRDHDARKSLDRPKNCNLNINEFVFLFSAFCFENRKTRISLENGQVYRLDRFMEEIEVIQRMKSVLEKQHVKNLFPELSINANALLNDITNVTSLFLYIDGIYQFVHKSVEEYFAAYYIEKFLTEHTISRFYEKHTFHSQGRQFWARELYYLRKLDKTRFEKYYLLALFRRVLNTEMLLTEENRSSFIKKLLVEIDLEVHCNYKFKPSKKDQFKILSKSLASSQIQQSIGKNAFAAAAFDLWAVLTPRPDSLWQFINDLLGDSKPKVFRIPKSKLDVKTKEYVRRLNPRLFGKELKHLDFNFDCSPVSLQAQIIKKLICADTSKIFNYLINPKSRSSVARTTNMICGLSYLEEGEHFHFTLEIKESVEDTLLGMDVWLPKNWRSRKDRIDIHSIGFSFSLNSIISSRAAGPHLRLLKQRYAEEVFNLALNLQTNIDRHYEQLMEDIEF